MPEIVPFSTAPIKAFSLSSPVRTLARPTLVVEPGDSLALASTRLLQNGSNFLPIVLDGKLTGVITGAGLAKALGDAAEFSDAVSGYREQAQTISAYSTGAEALRAFEGGKPLVVIDDDRRLVGVIAPADLFPRHRPRIRPASLGGLATPLGVFLTGGTVTAGVNRWSLVLMGACLSTIIFGAAIASGLFAAYLHTNGLQVQISNAIEIISFFLIFFVSFWFLLAGTHGAEHQVINAIERELQLTPEVVKRMTRYHPRCGTNYSVGLALFAGVFSIQWIDSDLLRLFLAAVVTLALWRPLSRFAQLFLTTRQPSEKQLNQAISAGEELLTKFATTKTTYPKPWVMLWNSGLPMVLAGLLPITVILSILVYALKLDFF